jgi:mono/diheme cytochrome c family protein
MTDDHTDTTGGSGSNGLWRWLVGGLVAGGVILGLLVASYAIGYDRGQDSAATSPPRSTEPAQPVTTAPVDTATEPPPTTPDTTSEATEATTPPTSTTIEPSPALVATGETLFTDDGCAGCHSLSGTAGAGPALDGAAGRQVELDSGETVTADDAYLERAIVDPDAQIVNGYTAGIMSAATASRGFADRLDDVRALVAFIKSQK